jgi:hypothetical protein
LVRFIPRFYLFLYYYRCSCFLNFIFKLFILVYRNIVGFAW